MLPNTKPSYSDEKQKNLYEALGNQYPIVNKWKNALTWPTAPEIKGNNLKDTIHRIIGVAQLCENISDNISLQKTLDTDNGISTAQALSQGTNITEQQATKYFGNSQQYLSENNAAGAIGPQGLAGGSGTSTGGLAGFDPILIPMIRRAAPNLMAYDVCSVQPMAGPTGLVFAMRAHYIAGGDANDPEALYNEADTGFSATSKATNRAYEFKADGTGSNTHPLGSFSSGGSNPGVLNKSTPGTYQKGATGMGRDVAEKLGTGTTLFQDMKFTIEKTDVRAGSRGLAADFTIELVQDLMSIHGLNAEDELKNILSSEIIAEINREIIRTIYTVAKPGAQNSSEAGRWILNDASGRWLVENFKDLRFQMELDANAIARETRRGKGNIVIVSSDVASALATCGELDYSSATTNKSGEPQFSNIDDTGNLYVGTLGGRIKVFVDPFGANNSNEHYYVMGYKGSHPWDAGIFYCPYIPLQYMRAVHPGPFQPRIGFKTRYGIIANPFVRKADGNPDGRDLTASRNQYYRRVFIDTLR